MAVTTILQPDTSKKVIRTFRSGNLWYNIYSDGWVEQGSRSGTAVNITITLPIAMLDANYVPIATHEDTVASAGQYTYYFSRTASNFRLVSNVDLGAFTWSVQGYASEAALRALQIDFAY